ncbi:MAG: sulfite exporter TauE/SafE family protein, partial [Phycisphaerales bacterium]
MTYAVIGAVLIGVSLGLLGSGGSILTVPILLALGHADKQAIAESLAIVGCISLFGAIRQGIRGEVDWRAAAFFAIPGTAGAYLGAKLAEFVPGPVQIVALGIIMLAAALMMAFYKIKECHGDEKPSVAVMIAVGLGVGTITGLVGIGGGFLIVPSLVLAGRVPLKRSIGTSLAVIVL